MCKERKVLCLAHCTWYILVSPVKGTLLPLNIHFKQMYLSSNKTRNTFEVLFFTTDTFLVHYR